MHVKEFRQTTVAVDVSVAHNSGEAIGVARGRAWGPSPPKGSGKNCTTVLAMQKGQIYVKVLGMLSNCECDSIYAAEMTNMTDLWLSGVFQAL